MKKIFSAVLCITFAAALFLHPAMAADKKLQKGEELFTRTNITTKGSTMFFHNMSKLKHLIPVGTAVTVKGVGASKIVFKPNDNRKKYVLKTPSINYDKYFVKDINEIGLESMSNDVREKIKKMTVAPGMTKEEVYVSRGCPAFLGWGQKSYYSSLEQVMTSNTWYYNKDSSKIQMYVKFKDNVVKEVITDKKRFRE